MRVRGVDDVGTVVSVGVEEHEPYWRTETREYDPLPVEHTQYDLAPLLDTEVIPDVRKSTRDTPRWAHAAFWAMLAGSCALLVAVYLAVPVNPAPPGTPGAAPTVAWTPDAATPGTISLPNPPVLYGSHPPATAPRTAVRRPVAPPPPPAPTHRRTASTAPTHTGVASSSAASTASTAPDDAPTTP